MPSRKVSWNYGTAPLRRSLKKRKYKERQLKQLESYATDRSLTAHTPSTQMADAEFAMEVLKDPYAQNNPYIRMGLDTGPTSQPQRVFNFPRGNVQHLEKPDPSLIGEYHRDKDAVTMYDSALTGLTPTEDRHILIHEIMHKGFASWRDIVDSNPKAKKAFKKMRLDKNLSSKNEYLEDVLDDDGGHPYIYPKGRKSGVFPDRFRGMQDREELRTERTIPQHRGIETQSGKIVNEDWDGWKRSWYTRPVPQSYLDAVDKYVIPYVIDRYPSLASHPAFRNIGKKDRVSKIKKSKRSKPESWNY